VAHREMVTGIAAHEDPSVPDIEIARADLEQTGGVSRICLLASSAACMAASPEVKVVVLPEVLCEKGVVSVSAKIPLTFSKRSPRVSAAIWSRTVQAP